MKQVLMKDRLAHLLRKAWVSPVIAWQEAGCMSLSQRCGELRRKGVAVIDRWKVLPDGRRFKEYRLSRG